MHTFREPAKNYIRFDEKGKGKSYIHKAKHIFIIVYLFILLDIKTDFKH